MYPAEETLWFVAGDPVFNDPALRAGLRRLVGVKVRMVPREVASPFWWRSQPDLLLYGASALQPVHPLVMRARAWPTRSVLVTPSWATAPGEEDADYVLPLPQSAGRIAYSLRRALGEPRVPTIELMGA